MGDSPIKNQKVVTVLLVIILAGGVYGYWSHRSQQYDEWANALSLPQEYTLRFAEADFRRMMVVTNAPDESNGDQPSYEPAVWIYELEGTISFELPADWVALEIDGDDHSTNVVANITPDVSRIADASDEIAPDEVEAEVPYQVNVNFSNDSFGPVLSREGGTTEDKENIEEFAQSAGWVGAVTGGVAGSVAGGKAGTLFGGPMGTIIGGSAGGVLGAAGGGTIAYMAAGEAATAVQQIRDRSGDAPTASEVVSSGQELISAQALYDEALQQEMTEYLERSLASIVDTFLDANLTGIELVSSADQ